MSDMRDREIADLRTELECVLNQRDVLGDHLRRVMLYDGVLEPLARPTGPELLMAAETYCNLSKATRARIGLPPLEYERAPTMTATEAQELLAAYVKQVDDAPPPETPPQRALLKRCVELIVAELEQLREKAAKYDNVIHAATTGQHPEGCRCVICLH